MPDNTEAWLKRAEVVLAEPRITSAIPFAISIYAALYGPQSTQLRALEEGLEQVAARGSSSLAAHSIQQEYALNAITNIVQEAKIGLISNLRAQVAGEVLSELVGLGKEILSDDTDPAKNVSAVLVAAAFEDMMRRLGAELAGVTARPKLEEVLTALKNAGILKGGEIGVAQSYLKFRNDSLHADWANVQKSQVQSCIAFVEALLLKHFS
jgi:diphthamide synthase (EF-2-diphthine--ammonia ligase)